MIRLNLFSVFCKHEDFAEGVGEIVAMMSEWISNNGTSLNDLAHCESVMLRRENNDCYEITGKMTLHRRYSVLLAD